MVVVIIFGVVVVDDWVVVQLGVVFGYCWVDFYCDVDVIWQLVCGEQCVGVIFFFYGGEYQVEVVV